MRKKELDTEILAECVMDMDKYFSSFKEKKVETEMLLTDLSRENDQFSLLATLDEQQNLITDQNQTEIANVVAKIILKYLPDNQINRFLEDIADFLWKDLSNEIKTQYIMEKILFQAKNILYQEHFCNQNSKICAAAKSSHRASVSDISVF